MKTNLILLLFCLVCCGLPKLEAQDVKKISIGIGPSIITDFENSGIGCHLNFNYFLSYRSSLLINVSYTSFPEKKFNFTNYLARFGKEDIIQFATNFNPFIFGDNFNSRFGLSALMGAGLLLGSREWTHENQVSTNDPGYYKVIRDESNTSINLIIGPSLSYNLRGSKIYIDLPVSFEIYNAYHSKIKSQIPPNPNTPVEEKSSSSLDVETILLNVNLGYSFMF